MLIKRTTAQFELLPSEFDKQNSRLMSSFTECASLVFSENRAKNGKIPGFTPRFGTNLLDKKLKWRSCVKDEVLIHCCRAQFMLLSSQLDNKISILKDIIHSVLFSNLII